MFLLFFDIIYVVYYFVCAVILCTSERCFEQYENRQRLARVPHAVPDYQPRLLIFSLLLFRYFSNASFLTFSVMLFCHFSKMALCIPALWVYRLPRVDVVRSNCVEYSDSILCLVCVQVFFSVSVACASCFQLYQIFKKA